ncbi:MAG: hypothetical protein QM743_03980 [Chitinophagaceae bacterium]
MNDAISREAINRRSLRFFAMRMLRLLLLLLPFQLAAQQKYTLTAEADVALKFTILNDPADHCRLWSNKAIAAGILIDDEDPTRIGFYGRAGLAEDIIRFPLRINSASFAMERFYIPLSGLIVFPTRLEQLKICAGIGIDINIYYGASIRQTDAIGYFQLDLEKAGSETEQLGNKIIPSIQAGCMYELNPQKHQWAVKLLLRQAVMRVLSEEQTVNYSINQQAMTLRFNPRPAYLSLGIVHFF